MIPYGRHSIDESDISGVLEVLRGDWLTTGPVVGQFESALSSIVGAPSISVSSGTAALHSAYAAIDLKRDEEVITPPLTFIATQATAALLGAKVVFADVQPDTGNIDPEKVSQAITKKTKAIVAVDYAGHPADLNELKKIAEDNGIYLIEDAAHSVGSTYDNKKVGSIADLTTFSFFPTKNITTGEGGAVSSLNEELIDRAMKFSRQGIVRDPGKFLIQGQGLWHQEVHEFGLNYRMPDILAALGISQLKKIEIFRKKKQNIVNQYNLRFQDQEDLVLPTHKHNTEVNWHLYPIRVKATRRNQIFNGLRQRGIGVQVNYMPAHWHPVFRKFGHKKGDYPVAESFYESEISLPLFPDLRESDVDIIAETLLELNHD